MSSLRCLLIAAFFSWHITAVFGSSAAATETVEISFEYTASGHIQTVIQLADGTSAPATIDTGANFAMFDVETIDGAGLTRPPPEAPTVDVLGMNGLSAHQTMTIPNVEVEQTVLGTLPVAVQPVPDDHRPGNVIPASAFPYRTLDFDFTRNRLQLYNSRPRRGNQQRDALNVRTINGLWFIRVRLNRVSGWALIDTGSNVTYANSAFADRAGLFSRPSDRDLVGIDQGAAEARQLRVRRFRIGEFRIDNFNLLVLDPPLFEHLGMAEEPVMVLGLNGLYQFRIQFDQEREKVYFSAPNMPNVANNSRSYSRR